MNNGDQLEILAEAFRIMTGHVAPFKDPPSCSYPAPFKVRSDAYIEWTKEHKESIHAMLIAFDKIKGNQKDDQEILPPVGGTENERG